MGKYSNRAKAPENETPLVPKTCGVAGCENETDIYIWGKGVARCATCYQNDVDMYNKLSSNKTARDYLRDNGQTPVNPKHPKNVDDNEYAQDNIAKMRSLLSGF